jgi:hypothetical protein
MRHNKVLGLAIASALALGANSSFSGVLTIKHVDNDGTNCLSRKDGGALIASEVFFPGDASVFSPIKTCGTPDNLDNSGADGPTFVGDYDDGFFYAEYKFDTNTFDTVPFLAQFTLDNGAQFSNPISLAADAALDFVAHPSGSHSGVTKNSGGAAGDSQVTFYITPKGEFGFEKGKPGEDTLFLRFNMKNLSVLKSPGEEIKMTAKVYPSTTDTTSFDGTTEPATVLTSTRATKVNLDSYGGTVQIDVAQESLRFVGTGNAFIDSTKVKLGSASISNNTSSGIILNADGSPWSFGTATGVLTIVNGPFSASLTSPGQVFLDFDNDGLYEPTNPIPDILGTIDPTNPTTAVWTLNEAQLSEFYSANNTAKVDIVLEVDGTTFIEEQGEAAQAVLDITYGGGVKETFKRSLIHIKRNGTVCSIYNVPSPDAMDEGNVRITNTSTKDDVKVSGSLRDKSGMYVFRNQVLTETLKANETLYIPSAELCDSTKYPKTSEWTTAKGDVCFEGRAILTINSDVNSLEIYGLVRNKAGGPLTNMSVGATGNGCD